MKAAILSTFVTISLLSTGALAAAEDFPSFDIFHSHCAVTVTFPNKLCANVFSELSDILQKFNAGADPAHGQYLFKERQPISYIWASHSSKYGWDSDVIFEPTQLGNDCQIRGRSRTKSTFHSAGTENYCDQWNVYQGMGSYNNMQIASCSAIPSDPQSTCTR